MYGYSPLLGIDTCPQHGGRAEEHTDSTLVHLLNHAFPCSFGLEGMNKLNLTGRYTQGDELVLDVLIDVPLMGLVGAEVAEHKLRASVLGTADIVVIDNLRTARSLVAGGIDEPVTQQTHVQRHLACYIGSYEHLRLFQIVGWQGVEFQIIPLSAVGKCDKAHDHFFLFGSRLVGEKLYMLVGNIQPHHFRRAVIGDFSEKRRQLRYLDIGAEAFLTLDGACHTQLVVGGFLGEDGSPCIETAHALLRQFARSEVLEKHIQFG